MRPILLALACALPLAASGDSFLLRGVTIHPVAGPPLSPAAILVRDGLIAEVAARIAAPAGVRVIQAPGLHVYPGMIDSATHIGLFEIGSVRETQDIAELGDFNPQLRAITAVNPASEHIAVTRANGITSVITMPAGGILSGQAALVHLDGWTWEEMAIAPSAAMFLRFPVVQTAAPAGSSRSARRRIPYSEARRNYEQQLQRLRDFFEQARRYRKAKAAPASGFQTDMKLEAMLPVLDKKIPLVIVALRERAIREALRFAEREQVRLTLAESAEAWKVAAELKARDVPVILGPTLTLPLNEDDPYDRPFTVPAELHKAGVKFAFGTFTTSAARNLPYQAAAAVAFGLPYEEALKAVTLYPAEIWGVADRLGSLEKGKWADLIVTDGDPLETRSQVKQVFVRGRPIDLDNKHRRLYEKYLNRP